jgi:hypothetical protein
LPGYVPAEVTKPHAPIMRRPAGEAGEALTQRSKKRYLVHSQADVVDFPGVYHTIQSTPTAAPGPTMPRALMRTELMRGLFRYSELLSNAIIGTPLTPQPAGARLALSHFRRPYLVVDTIALPAAARFCTASRELTGAHNNPSAAVAQAVPMGRFVNRGCKFDDAQPPEACSSQIQAWHLGYGVSPVAGPLDGVYASAQARFHSRPQES